MFSYQLLDLCKNTLCSVKWHSFRLWKILLIMETKSTLPTSWPMASGVAWVKGSVQKLMSYWLSQPASPCWQFELQMQKLSASWGQDRRKEKYLLIVSSGHINAEHTKLHEFCGWVFQSCPESRITHQVSLRPIWPF